MHATTHSVSSGRAGGRMAERVARRVVLLTLIVVPLFVWPWSGNPFLAPRLILLAVSMAATAGLLVAASVPWPRWPPVVVWSAVAWLASIGVSGALAPHASLEAMVVPVAAVAWGAMVAWSGVDRREAAAALVVSASIVGAWAGLQWLGIDPFRLAGWQVISAGSLRMRVYASLGNPNFVGAFLVAVVPLSVTMARLRPSAAALVAIALQLAGIAATGSRGAFLGAMVGVSIVVLRGRTLRHWLVPVAAVALILLGLAIRLGPARPLDDTLRGRLFIWSLTVPHALDHPLTGFGPGGFAVEYPGWEVERVARGIDRDLRQFMAPTRHAHNDYLEALVELGIPGLVSWLAIVASVVWCGWKQRAAVDGAFALGALGGIAALAAVALVDFPFARFVESMTWWTLAAIALGPGLRKPAAPPAPR